MDKKRKFLNYLKIGLNPFKKFVATGEIEEDLGLVQSRRDILIKIGQYLKEKGNIFIPIIGNIGMGKTHLFWSLKQEFFHENIIYLSLEKVYKKFFYSLYSEYIEELSVETLRNITNNLCNQWGAKEKAFGFFQVADIEKVQKNAFSKISEDFHDKVAVMDAINAIVAHQLDPYKKLEAENWLLGELMDFKDLARLNLMHDLRDRNNAYTMLKILIENSEYNTAAFFDDIDQLISEEEPSDDSSQIFDPSWLYGDENANYEQELSDRTLAKILRLQDIEGLKIIMTFQSVENFTQIKKKIEIINPETLQLIKDPLFLCEFREKEIFSFYRESIRSYLKSVNYLEFLDEFPNTYFPLTETILKNIYTKSIGNPREIIKYLIKIFNEIIYSERDLTEIQREYEIIENYS